MRTLPALLEQHRNQLRDEWPWIWLFEIEVPTEPPTRYRLASFLQPVQFGVDSAGDPLTFSPFPIVHGGLTETTAGDIPSLTITIGNASLEVARVVEEHGGLVGAPVVIRLVSMVDLLNPASEIREDSEVRRARVRGEAIVMVLSAYNLYRRMFPAWRSQAFSCRSHFGGLECGYAIPAAPTNTVGGGFDFCPKTLAACTERGADELARGVTVQHPERWDARPGLPRNLGGA